MKLITTSLESKGDLIFHVPLFWWRHQSISLVSTCNFLPNFLQRKIVTFEQFGLRKLAQIQLIIHVQHLFFVCVCILCYLYWFVFVYFVIIVFMFLVVTETSYYSWFVSSFSYVHVQSWVEPSQFSEILMWNQ